MILSITVMRQTCAGLEHLHAKQIIHRDIKSDNVLLDASGHVKISPCGLRMLSRSSNSRLRLLRQADRAEQAVDHGRDGSSRFDSARLTGTALLDGARGRQAGMSPLNWPAAEPSAEGVRRQSRHLVPRHHGHRLVTLF